MYDQLYEEYMKYSLPSQKKPEAKANKGSRPAAARSNDDRLQKTYLYCFTVAELQEICRYKNLRVSGNKDEIIDRIVDAKTTFSELCTVDVGDEQPELPVMTTASTAEPRLTDHHLSFFTVSALQDVCRYKNLKVSGRRDEIIDRLSAAGTTFDDLHAVTVDDLKRVLEYFDAPLSGAKKVLIERIKRLSLPETKSTASMEKPRQSNNDHRPTPSIVSKPAPPSAQSSAPPSASYYSQPARAPQPSGRTAAPLFERMTAARFRTMHASINPASVWDTEVCHIISRANGGADARENYILLNGALNRRLGRYGDHVMVYLVGIHWALTAVEASKCLNNYNGPSAQELYHQGEAFFRNNFGAHLRSGDRDERVREAESMFL